MVKPYNGHKKYQIEVFLTNIEQYLDCCCCLEGLPLSSHESFIRFGSLVPRCSFDKNFGGGKQGIIDGEQFCHMMLLDQHLKELLSLQQLFKTGFRVYTRKQQDLVGPFGSLYVTLSPPKNKQTFRGSSTTTTTREKHAKSFFSICQFRGGILSVPKDQYVQLWLFHKRECSNSM